MLPFGRRTWNPNVVLAPAPSVPLYGMLRAVTVWPLSVKLAFHPPWKVWPEGNVNVTDQPLIVVVLLLVTRVGSTTYPSPHCVCTVAAAAQPLPVPPDCVVAVTALEVDDTLPAASTARTWYRYVVLALSPELVNEADVDVPICAKEPPLAPGARSIW